jgi:hypothetical protein
LIQRLQTNIDRGAEVLVRLEERAAELREEEEKPSSPAGDRSPHKPTAQSAPADVAAAVEEAVLQDGFLEKPQNGGAFEDPAYDHAIEIMRRELLPPAQVWVKPEECPVFTCFAAPEFAGEGNMGCNTPHEPLMNLGNSAEVSASGLKVFPPAVTDCGLKGFGFKSRS